MIDIGVVTQQDHRRGPITNGDAHNYYAPGTPFLRARSIQQTMTGQPREHEREKARLSGSLGRSSPSDTIISTAQRLKR